MYLDGFVGHVNAHLRGHQLGDGRFLYEWLVGVHQTGRVHGCHSRRMDPNGHVCQHELDALVLGNGLAEGLPSLGETHRSLKGRLSDAHTLGCDDDSALGQYLHRQVEASAAFA